MKVTIFGAGKVGKGIAKALRTANVEATVRSSRRGLPRRQIAADILLLTVRDPAIATWARRIATASAVSSTAVVFHTAGSRGPDELRALHGRVRGVGQFHPMLSFADSKRPPRMARAHVLLDGDAAALKAGRRLARALDMTARVWPHPDLAAYHAAGAMLANGGVALASAASGLLHQAGADPHETGKILGPLLRSVADNIERLGTPHALSGPVRRGDAAAVVAHFAALEPQVPEIKELYLAALRVQCVMARELGDADPDGLRKIDTFAAARQRDEPRRGNTKAAKNKG